MTRQDRDHGEENRGPPARTKIQRQAGCEPLSRGVIETVAELTETEPEQMQPLYDVIDPDALDGVFQPRATEKRQPPRNFVTFQFEGCDVTVYSDGGIMASLVETGQA